jgi:hypothetical protein
MPRDANGKITYEMKSVGDAFQEHLEKHHNVSAVTPVWLEGGATKKNQQKLSNLKRKSQAINLMKGKDFSMQKLMEPPSL